MTSIHTHHRAIAVAVTALTITAITAPVVSARPHQSPHKPLHASPAASAPAPRAQAASRLERPSRDASANPHGKPAKPTGLSTLPRKFTTAKDRRGIASVNAEKPVAPSDPATSQNILKKVGRAVLIVTHSTHHQPTAGCRRTSTHTFSSDGKQHIPAGDLHSDPADIHRPRPPRIGHIATQAVGGGIGAAGSALTAPPANTLSSPPATPAPLKSGPARAAAPAAPPTPHTQTPLGVPAPASAGRGRLRLPQPAGRY